jgi:DNA polymerase III delta prime subunit
MPLLNLQALPPQTTKGTIVRLLIEVGGLDRRKIGAIELRGRTAAVEVPEDWLDRLVHRLDGANLANHLIRAAHGARRAVDREDHFARLLRLLEVESEAEAQQTADRLRRLSPAAAEQAGESLIGLTLREQYLGLGGRTLVTLGKRDVRRALPWTRLGIGSPVLLTEEDAPEGVSRRGVVSDRTELTIEVAVHAPLDDAAEDATFRLDLSSDEVARERQRMALERAGGARGNRLADLRTVLLGQRPPEFAAAREADEPAVTLNASQQEAIRFALSARDVAIIHGPPGTGKTTTLVELIRQAIQRGATVLACAPSNLAVDNVLERLLAAGERAVRLGHPARVQPQLRAHTLDLIVDQHPDVRLARRLVREADSLRAQASRYTRAKPLPGARRELRDEARRLVDDARRLELQVVQEVLSGATVLCSTTTGLDSEILGQRQFDLAVVDEACQSTEPGCWIPVLRCDRLVLAGDHCQLPPTLVSPDAVREGFHVSLLERLMGLYGPQISRRLDVQYRMHQAIMEFSSAQFYEGTLQADATVSAHRLSDLPGVAASELTQQPVDFIDTAGAGYDEQLEPDGESRWNPREAELVVRKVESLAAAGLPPTELAVIAPYSAQVRWLRSLLAERYSGLEIDSVDGFQGREKEAVIISLVRSNPVGEIGFLADVRRMNVALTRARRKLIVIGDSSTIGHHDFYRELLEYFELLGAYHTVWEEGV